MRMECTTYQTCVTVDGVEYDCHAEVDVAITREFTFQPEASVHCTVDSFSARTCAKPCGHAGECETLEVTDPALLAKIKEELSEAVHEARNEIAGPWL